MNLNKDEIINVPLNTLNIFPDHPFSVKDDDNMEQLVDSIKEQGVLTPLIVRRIDEDNYEIISGHRRSRACELAGITNVPVIVKECTREEAIVMMVDSNLQRDQVLP